MMRMPVTEGYDFDDAFVRKVSIPGKNDVRACTEFNYTPSYQFPLRPSEAELGWYYW